MKNIIIVLFVIAFSGCAEVHQKPETMFSTQRVIVSKVDGKIVLSGVSVISPKEIVISEPFTNRNAHGVSRRLLLGQVGNCNCQISR